MRAQRLLGVSLASIVAAAAFASCKGSTTAGAGTSGGGGATTTTSMGGRDAGPGTGGGKVDAGPILCLPTSTNVPMGACDLINQDCPPGATCKPSATPSGPATACLSAWGLKTADEDCYVDGECDAKLICVGLTAQRPGKCVAFCCPDTGSEPCNGGICNERVDFGGGYFAYVCSYGKRCQVLAPDACPAGFDCHVESAAGQQIAVCLEPSPSPVAELGTCHYINDCGNMQDCFGLTGTSAGVCLYYCALSGPSTGAAPGLGGCPTGETCESLYQGSPVDTGVDGVGLCIPAGGIQPPDAGADGGDAGDASAGDAGPDDAGDAGAGDAGDAGITDAGAGG